MAGFFQRLRTCEVVIHLTRSFSDGAQDSVSDANSRTDSFSDAAMTSSAQQQPQSSASSSSTRPRRSYKVKQYLTERYESDLESPGPATPSLASRVYTVSGARASSIDSPFDDVFSPSPGVFSKQRVFTFSPDRDSDLRRAKISARNNRKYNPSPLSLAPTDKSRPRVPSQGRLGSSLDDPETPVFYSPAVALTPSSSSPAPRGSVFQFNTPLARHVASLDHPLPYHALRSPIPVSPLAKGIATSSLDRSLHHREPHRDFRTSHSVATRTVRSSISTSGSRTESVTSPPAQQDDALSASDDVRTRNQSQSGVAASPSASKLDAPTQPPAVAPTIFAGLPSQAPLIPPLVAMLRHPAFAHAPPLKSTDDTPSPPTSILPPFQTYLSHLAKSSHPALSGECALSNIVSLT